jgi:hypothetical protein
MDLVFQRSYRSQLDYNGPLGHRWTHSYDWRLAETNSFTYRGKTGNWMFLQAIADPAAGLYNGDFRGFLKQPDGSYRIRDEVAYRLDKDGDDGWRVMIPGGLSYQFDTNGILQRISHPAGQCVTLAYSNSYPKQLLLRVEHSNGKYLDFAYTNDLIAQVTTPSTNLSLSFSYNCRGELIEATRHTGRGDFKGTYTYNAAGVQ